MKEQFPVIPNRYISRSDHAILIVNDTVFLNTQKFSGYLFLLQPNQKDTASIEPYLDGLLNGTSRKWYPSQQLMEKREYRNGQKNGWQIAYWENGNKRFEFTAHNDAYEGELKEWTVDGKLIHLAHYTNGQEEGIQKLWHDNGKIRANYTILNGKRYGLLGTKNCKNVSDSIFLVK